MCGTFRVNSDIVGIKMTRSQRVVLDRTAQGLGLSRNQLVNVLITYVVNHPAQVEVMLAGDEPVKRWSFR